MRPVPLGDLAGSQPHAARRAPGWAALAGQALGDGGRVALRGAERPRRRLAAVAQVGGGLGDDVVRDVRREPVTGQLLGQRL
ncbi:hypothetical protein [Phytohabitans suffuscus]|uniref:hypothetical protein n=1 Tax=Phytohabitans suffuscus TaxID=624315 RepID=UPI001E2C00A9|nr:hypothetical protein [Phytohabitans suffuscus]